MKNGYAHKLLASGLLLLTILLAGCVDIDVAVKINPDGSGTVTESMLLKSDLGLKSNGKPHQLQVKPLDDLTIARKIAGYGGQVRLLSNQALSAEGQVGYRAVFGFDDINKLKVPIDPNTGKDFYTFHQTRDKTIQLDISNTMDWLAESTKEPTLEEKKLVEAFASDQKMKVLINTLYMRLKDANFSIHLELTGKIIKSNATYQQGGVIDLMTMDFNQMMRFSDFGKVMAMQSMGKSPSKEEIMAMQIPGMKVDYQKLISVEYQ